MEYQQAPFSKKLNNGGFGSLSGKHIYDGVFGGEVKSKTTRMEDYKEIFGGSSTCSIPILDFPELKSNASESSSRPDYSTIFGGFGEADFAAPYEELVIKSSKTVNSFSKEARTPAEPKFSPTSTTARPQQSNVSREQHTPSPEISGVKEFNVSYNKSNQGSKNGVNGMTHIAQLHSVPGYACLVDETTSPQLTESLKPVRTVLKDARVNTNVSQGMKPPKYLRKVVSGPQPRGAVIDDSTSHAESKKKSSRNRSFSNKSFDDFETNLDTRQPISSPLSSVANLNDSKGGSMRSMSSKFGVFESDSAEEAAGSHLPPLFDDEMDANSAAGTSVAALRKAIEEAQAKMTKAKELMERKRQGRHSREKKTVNDGLKVGRKEDRVDQEANRCKDEVAQETSHKVYTAQKQVFTGLPESNATKASQITSDHINAEKVSAVKNAIGEAQSKESKRDQVNHRLEAEIGIATNGFSEPAGGSDQRTMVLEIKQANNVEKMKPCTDGNDCKAKMAGDETMKKPMEGGKKLKAFDEAPMQEKVERVLNSMAAAFKWDLFKNIIKSDENTQCQEEKIDKSRAAYENEDAAQTPEVTCEHKQCESITKRSDEPEKEAKYETQEMEGNKDMYELKASEDSLKTRKKEIEAHGQDVENQSNEENDQEKVENQSNEVPLRKENERRLHEIYMCKENWEGQKEDFDKADNEKQQERWDYKENEKKQNGVSKPEDTETFDQVQKLEVTEANYNDSQGKEEHELKFREYCSTKVNGHLDDAKETEETLNQINENETEKTCEWLEAESMQTEIHLAEDIENTLEATQQSFRCQDNLESTKVHKLNENDNACEVDETHAEENFEGLEVTSEAASEENDRMVEVSGDSIAKETEIGTKAVEEAFNLAEEGNLEIEYDAAVSKHVKHIEEVAFQLDENDKDVTEPEIGLNQEENESTFASRCSGNGMESNTLCNPEKQVGETICELGENNDMKEPGVGTNHEDDFESFLKVDNRIGEHASQQPHNFEGEGKNIAISPEEKTHQSTHEKAESRNETQTVEKRDSEDTLQKEMGSEKKHHGTKEETKLREMEKEKERIVVERAIREARERAFTEARERAERAAAKKAAAEAHQRVMTEARERLEKACAEAIGKSGKTAAEKASMEAKLKAERAAVERATVEARERALERALSEIAAFNARNRAEMFTAEKFSGVSRDAGLNSYDQQYKGPAPSSSSRHPTSSNHDGPYSTERFNGTNGESVERCKATLERNQRTAERAAKALAEKNMRDLLAQKEQAERNRLAENLDADVKRWSSGKERNLRALLSTLQYILGPDSGWQPIPLTDLITSAAVKKAYRKATLFVHPDKLQQRGASIPQKYTCEKVFDLLKDAWNKFSIEER
ncbi:auxilin-like protein 1 isoform X2 [Mercurialis annua]|uniref:auxilin-like protein 1 isoform X2 n=1 Tax=Mercurialis annua TaxID=3986 RepID=UPI00215FEB45|nr:auxilin-like protein 1 isoform X2 [Mercurialis annua]